MPRDPETGRFVVADLEPRTKEQVHEIAYGVLRNEIFVAWTPEQLETCFMLIIGLLRREQLPGNAHTMCGRVEHRVQMGINGLPLFHTGQWLTLEDTKAVHAEYHRLLDLVEST